MSLMVEFPVDTLAKTIDCSRKTSSRLPKTIRRRNLESDWLCSFSDTGVKNKDYLGSNDRTNLREQIEEFAPKVPVFWEPSDEIGDICFDISLDMENRDGDSSPNRCIEEDFEQAVDTYIREKQFYFGSSSTSSGVSKESTANDQSSSALRTRRSSANIHYKQRGRKVSKVRNESVQTHHVMEQNLKQEAWTSNQSIENGQSGTFTSNIRESLAVEAFHGNVFNEFYDPQTNEPDTTAEDFLRIADPEPKVNTMIQKRRSSSNSDASSGSQKKRTKTLSSRFRGVSKCTKDGRWQARIRIGSVVKYLGRFRDEIEAAHCYDAAAHKYHGARAMPNFGPDGVCLIDKREIENKKDKQNDSDDSKEFRNT